MIALVNSTDTMDGTDIKIVDLKPRARVYHLYRLEFPEGTTRVSAEGGHDVYTTPNGQQVDVGVSSNKSVNIQGPHATRLNAPVADLPFYERTVSRYDERMTVLLAQGLIVTDLKPRARTRHEYRIQFPTGTTYHWVAPVRMGYYGYHKYTLPQGAIITVGTYFQELVATWANANEVASSAKTEGVAS